MAGLILGDERQDPGIMRIIIEISQTMTFKINGGLCLMMFLAVIEKYLKRALSKPLCLHVEMRSFVASLVHNTISSFLLVFAIHCMCFWSIYL